MAKLVFHRYGKTRVRMTQVIRRGEMHEVTELSVKILFEGDFDESYTKADNGRVLPTDTMKNTAYVVARQKPIVSPEAFAKDLADHFLSRVDGLKRVTVEIVQTPWARIGEHASAFVQNGAERRTAVLSATRSETEITGGIKGLEILRTANSAFSGFLKDEYTTLPETRDRLLGTVLDADWTYHKGELDFNSVHAGVRQTLLETFASHRSESVQHTLFDMASAALEGHAAVREIHLIMPNKHRLLVDLARFGLDNPNQIFIATDEPSGCIEARLSK